MVTEGPQGLLTPSGQPLNLKRCRSLSERSRVCPKLRPRRTRGTPSISEKLRRATGGSGFPLPSRSEASRTVSRPRLPEIAEVSEPGGHGRRWVDGGRRGSEAGRLRARKPLRKNPRFAERRWLTSDSGKRRRLPISGGPSDSGKSRRSPIGSGPSGSGAARRRPSARPAGQLEAAAAPCLMLRYSSEENPPASPSSRRRERLRCPRRGRPRPPAAAGS